MTEVTSHVRFGAQKRTSPRRRNEVTTRRMRATNATNASPRAHPGILMPISRYGRGRRFNPYSAHHFSLSNRIASLVELEVSLLRGTIEDLRRDRDSWREQAPRLALPITHGNETTRRARFRRFDLTEHQIGETARGVSRGSQRGTLAQ